MDSDPAEPPFKKLRRLRKAAKLTQEKLAKLAHTSQQQITKLENGKRKLSVMWASRIAPHIGTSVESLVGLDSLVSIVGYVGAGGQAFYGDGQGELGEAPRPPGFPIEGVALIVRGDSMPGVADDGSVIYYAQRNEQPTDDMLGKVCVICLPDGRVLLKRLLRGSAPGLYDLMSTGYPMLRDQKVIWAARVDWIRPS